MARSEARLAASIWSDQDFIALNPTAQRMFMFLLSQPDLAHDGVIALRERRWSKSAAGLTPAQVDQDLKELHAARFIVIDEDAEELLIRSFIRRDKVFRQPNVLRAAQDHLDVVTSPTIRAEIAAELRRILDTEDIKDDPASIIAAMLDAIGNPSGNPSPNPSDMPTANPSGDVSAGNKGSGNPSDNPSPKGSQVAPGERGVVTVVPQGVSPYPFPLSSDPVPLPAPPARNARATPGKRGTRIPDDFTVTPDMVEWAHNNAPDIDGRRETEKFINYWRGKSGKDATKVDWAATWRNWMLNAAERRPANGRASPRVPAADAAVADAAALSARLAAQEQP